MRVKDIEYALAVARAGTIGRAAESIGISQPALSKALARLEGSLKTKLFNRLARGVELTEDGALFLDHGQKVVLHAMDAQAALRDIRQGMAGTIKIGLGVGVPTAVVTAAIEKLRQHDKVGYFIATGMTNTLYTALRRGELDLIISGVPRPEDGEFIYEKLWSDPMVPYIPRTHPLARKSATLSAQQLAAEKWVLPERGTIARSSFDSALRGLGVPPPIPLIETSGSGRDAELALDLKLILLMPQSFSKDARIDAAFLMLTGIPQLVLNRSIGIIRRQSSHIAQLTNRFKKHLKSGIGAWSQDAGR